MRVWAPALLLVAALLACQAKPYTDNAPYTNVDHKWRDNNNDWNKNKHRDTNDKSAHDHNRNDNRYWDKNHKSSLENKWNKNKNWNNNEQSNDHNRNRDGKSKLSHLNDRDKNKQWNNKYNSKDDDRTIDKSRREYGYNDKEKYSRDYERSDKKYTRKYYHCRHYNSGTKKNFFKSHNNKHYWKNKRRNWKKTEGRYFRRIGKSGRWWWCRKHRKSFEDNRKKNEHLNDPYYPSNDHRNFNWNNNYGTNIEKTHKNIPDHNNQNTNSSPAINIVINNPTADNANQNPNKPQNSADMDISKPDMKFNQQPSLRGSISNFNANENYFPDNCTQNGNNNILCDHTKANSQPTNTEGMQTNTFDKNEAKESGKQNEDYNRRITVNTINEQQVVNNYPNISNQKDFYNQQPDIHIYIHHSSQDPTSKTSSIGLINKRMRETEENSKPSPGGKESVASNKGGGVTEDDDKRSGDRDSENVDQGHNEREDNSEEDNSGIYEYSYYVTEDSSQSVETSKEVLLDDNDLIFHRVPPIHGIKQQDQKIGVQTT